MDTMGFALAGVLSVHLAAVEIAAGIHIFFFLLLRPQSLGAPDVGARMAADCRRLALFCVVAAGLTLVAWMWLVLETVLDTPAQASLAEIAAIVTGTHFGRVWLARLVLVLAAGLALLEAGRKAGPGLSGLLSCLLLLGSLSLTSHVAAGHPRYIPILGLHLAATAAWVGSLPPLVLVLHRASRLQGPWTHVATRVVRAYAPYGAVAVAILLGGGVAMAHAVTGGRLSVADDYSRVLMTKVTLFAAMAAVGVVNRMAISPRILRGERGALSAMVTTASLEFGLAVAVYGATAILSQTSPP